VRSFNARRVTCVGADRNTCQASVVRARRQRAFVVAPHDTREQSKLVVVIEILSGYLHVHP
jgi:hypothetical protein